MMLNPFAAVVVPVFEMEKRVVVPEAVEDAIRKSVVAVSVEEAWMVSFAEGDELPIPTRSVPVNVTCGLFCHSAPLRTNRKLLEVLPLSVYMSRPL